MKRPSTRTLCGIAAMIPLLGLALYGWRTMESKAAIGPQAAARSANRDGRPTVSKRIVDWNEFSGRFEPTASVEIRARVSGHLQSINFEDGQIVEAGHTLFVIDPRPYQAAAAEAEARLVERPRASRTRQS